jgi:hypothetical protein
MDATFNKRMEELETYYPIKVDYLPEPKRPNINTLLSKSYTLASTLNNIRGLKPYYADVPSNSFRRRTEAIEPPQEIKQNRELVEFIEEPILEAKHDTPPTGEMGWRDLLKQDELFNAPQVQLQDDGIGAIPPSWHSNPREQLSNYHFPTDILSASVNMLY